MNNLIMFNEFSKWSVRVLFIVAGFVVCVCVVPVYLRGYQVADVATALALGDVEAVGKLMMQSRRCVWSRSRTSVAYGKGVFP